ncbi:uncharacterized protein LOC119600984 [Lucilia sericata]|uniref:uncharacterized protein LOC119600984 n=1 Tax=Lucilia sericata TaxID=13632 RepID=UPI0018A7EADA|nr:uncharacterized protein LOC119600984 [Lucilia sericata]
MYLLTSCTILLLGLFCCVMGDNDKDKCLKPCPFVFKPVCGTIEDPQGKPLDCTFPNDCFLENFKCLYGKKEIAQKSKICQTFPPECIDIVLGVL